jgi:ABC-type lipoprotein export system ATPase subunit
MTILSTQKIFKSFHEFEPITLIEDLSISFKRGSSSGIIGPSGVGKSTLLHLLGGLDNPTEGTLFFESKPFTSYRLPDLRQNHFGFIFQSHFLIEDLSLLENVLFPAKVARKKTHKGSSAYLRALELLERVSLLEKINLPAYCLSGGEKQRTALARALMNDPDILFADEPTGNLDSFHAKNIQDLLIDLTTSFNKTLIVVTHDESFAGRLDVQFKLHNKTLLPL